MLLGIFNLHACAFIYDNFIVTWALYQKRKYLTDRSDVIFEVPKAQKSKFSGAPPRTTLAELTQRPTSWWRRNSLPLH